MNQTDDFTRIPESTRHQEAIIEIHRVKKQAVRFWAMALFLDGEPSGSLGHGQSKSFEVAPGDHTIEVMLGTAGSQACKVTLHAGETAVFECEAHTGLTGPSLDFSQLVLRQGA